MTYVLAYFAGILGAAIGFVAALFAGDIVTRMMGVSDFEGGRGMLLVFVIGPAGGLVGLIAGVTTAFVLRSRGVDTGGVVVKVIGMIVLIAACLAAAPRLYGVLFPPDMLGTGNNHPVIDFELRLPAGVAVPADRQLVRVTLSSDKGATDAELAEGWRRVEDGRTVIAGSVPVYFRSGSRLLVLRLPLEPDRIFRLALRPDPRRTAELGPWQRVDLVAGAAAERPRAPPAGEAAELRLLVRDRF